jgi:hypothetical protein
MGREQGQPKKQQRKITWGHKPVGNRTWMRRTNGLITRMGASSWARRDGCGEEGEFGSG